MSNPNHNRAITIGDRLIRGHAIEDKTLGIHKTKKKRHPTKKQNFISEKRKQLRQDRRNKRLNSYFEESLEKLLCIKQNLESMFPNPLNRRPRTVQTLKYINDAIAKKSKIKLDNLTKSL